VLRRWFQAKMKRSDRHNHIARTRPPGTGLPRRRLYRRLSREEQNPMTAGAGSMRLPDRSNLLVTAIDARRPRRLFESYRPFRVHCVQKNCLPRDRRHPVFSLAASVAPLSLRRNPFHFLKVTVQAKTIATAKLYVMSFTCTATICRGNNRSQLGHNNSNLQATYLGYTTNVQTKAQQRKFE